MVKIYKTNGKVEIKELKKVEIKVNDQKIKLVVASI